MPPRNPELPEGTDHIINGAMETKAASGSGDDAGSGFIAGQGKGSADDTGGTAIKPVKQQLRESATSLKDEATTKIRSFAEDGKSRASNALDDFSKVVHDAANSIDERLGAEYGGYARRAAESVTNLAESLRAKDVDELYEDVRGAVRKSPALAIGAAAAVGFVLVRLVKTGLSGPDEGEPGALDNDVGRDI
ncbi:hypothetical protein [Allosphingosinicella humi]